MSRDRIVRGAVAMVVMALLLLVACLCSGCNKQLLDITYSYDYAIIGLPNGEVVEGKVGSWKDFDDGDQIQVVIEGKTYLVHSENVVLISE